MDGLARRYGIHPDAVLTGDVSILRRVAILAEAYPPAGGARGEGPGE